MSDVILSFKGETLYLDMEAGKCFQKYPAPKAAKQAGVFWLIEEELFAIPYVDGAQAGLAKSGKNYNHRLLWEHVRPKGCSRSFDYYPRGRLEFDSRGRAVIFMSPYIEQRYLQQIMDAFGITEASRVHYDGSRHYQCYLDREGVQNVKEKKNNRERRRKN